MPKNDTALIRSTDIGQAIGLLTRLPVPIAGQDRGSAAAWAYPLAGLLVATLAGMGAILAQRLGMSDALAALICLALMIIATGALHEDGLADTADGLWGGWTRAARLEIMKDSHIGTYGVLALILSLGIRWAALWQLLAMGSALAIAALITASMLSRAALPSLMAALPHARASGLSHRVGRVAMPTAALAWGVGIVIALVLTGGAALPALIWAGIATVITGRIARQKIGGQTGDILGATQQICEIVVLLSFAT